MDTPRRDVYQLRISLRNIDPPIWRLVEVWEDTPLDQLHRVIQTLFAWTGAHQHEFSAKGQAVAHGNARVHSLLTTNGDELEYLYDFGDNWRHRITLHSILPPEAGGVFYPQCIAGERKAPPENAGGPYAFMRRAAEPSSSKPEPLLIGEINQSLREAFPATSPRTPQRRW